MWRALRNVTIAALIPFANFAAVNAAENIPIKRLAIYALATALIGASIGLASYFAFRSSRDRVIIATSAALISFFSFAIISSFFETRSDITRLAVYGAMTIAFCGSIFFLAKFDWFRRFWTLTLTLVLAFSILTYTIRRMQINDNLANLTNVVRMDYRGVGTAVAPLSPEIAVAKPTDGAAIMGLDLAPKSANAKFRVHVVANAYSEVDTIAVIAVFRDNKSPAVSIHSAPVPARKRIIFEFTFDIITDRRLPIGLQVRIGPAEPGTLLINGPAQPIPAEAAPYLSARELEPGRSQISAHDEPDVYYVTLDAYPRVDTLREVFAFDNQPFIQALENDGFQVATKSFANYMATLLSVPAALQQRYVADETEVNFWNRTPSLMSIINGDNAVFKHFQDDGYFVSKLNFLDQCPLDAYVDYCYIKKSGINPWVKFGITDFELSLLQLTPIFPLLQIENPDFFKSRVIVEDLDDVLDLISAHSERPRFVYAHVWLPHAPYRFEADCHWASKIDLSGANDPIPKQRFLDQVKCANLKVMEIVNRILTDDQNAIILINSDHGSGFNIPWSLPYQEWPVAAVNERFGNFIAMRLPQRCKSYFYDAISPVNYFELIFACIDGRTPNFLEDRIYISTFDKSHPQYGRLWRFR